MLTKLAGVVAVLLLGAVWGCASPLSMDAPPSPVRVEIENTLWEDLSVFVEREGSERPLGRIMGLKTTTLQLPRYLVETGAPIRLVVRPRAGTVLTRSCSFSVEPGDHVHWVVEHTPESLGLKIQRHQLAAGCAGAGRCGRPPCAGRTHNGARYRARPRATSRAGGGFPPLAREPRWSPSRYAAWAFVVSWLPGTFRAFSIRAGRTPGTRASTRGPER